MTPSEGTIHTCPSEAELRRYHAKELPEDAEAGVREHLATCAACAQRAAGLLSVHNTWVARVRAAKSAVRDALSDPQPHVVGLGPGDVPGYEILSVVRRGGQGIVFRALQKSTKREVALKVLREGPYASAAARRRFEREIEVVAGLSHPHIVTVFDSGVTADGRKYFVMDYVPGQPLDRFVAAQGASLGDTLALLSEVCRAVNHAHQRGVIHRDLKPSNILVDEAGEPHVLDFGLARPVTEQDATAMTTTGQVAGTLPYMSPEQARGLPDAVDVRSDVYALGVILYELLTGTYPYPVEGDVIQVLKHIAETPPTPPGERTRARRRADFSPRGAAQAEACGSSAASLAPVAHVDEELETIVLKALAKEREQRYQSAGELARDINHYLAGEPIEAKRDSGWYMLKKTLYRYRLGAAVAVAFVVLVAMSAVVFAVMYANQNRLRADAEHQAQVARTAEGKAREAFGRVRELANDFVFQLDERIRRLPGSAEARRWAAEKGLEYLELLAAEAQQDLHQQRYVAGAYMTIGDIQGGQNTPSLGDLTGALASYHQAAEMLEGIAAVEPDSVPVLDGLGLNLIKIADVQDALGNRNGALASLREAISVTQHALALEPGRLTLRIRLANAHERTGLILQARGGTDAALGHYQAYLEIVEELVAGRPKDLWVQRSVTVGRVHVVEVRYAQGRLAEALEGYQEFRTRSRELLDANPGNVVARHDLATAHQWVGIVLADMGKPDAALDSLGKSLAVLEEWLKDDPKNETAQSALAATCIKLGETHMAAGQREQARASLQRAVELTEALAEGGSELAEVPRLRGDAYQQMARLETMCAREETTPRGERIRHWEAAREWLQKRLEVLTEMRARELLGPEDAGLPDGVAAGIERCDVAISALTAVDSRPSAGAPRSQPGE